MSFDSDNGQEGPPLGGRPSRRTEDLSAQRGEMSRTTGEYLQRLQARIQDFHEKLAAFDAAERSDPLLDSVPVRPPVTGFSQAPATSAPADASTPMPRPAGGLSAVSRFSRGSGAAETDAPPAPTPPAPGVPPAPAPRAERNIVDLTPRDSQRRAEESFAEARRRAEEILRQANADADATRSAAEATAADLRSLAQRDAAAVRAQAQEEARQIARRADEDRVRADQEMRQMWASLEADAQAIQDEVARRVDRLAQTIEDTRQEAGRIRSAAAAEAETLRRDATATVERLVGEAEAESRRLINAAQKAATTVRESAISGVRAAAEREAREARQHLAQQIREAAIVAIKLVDRGGSDPLERLAAIDELAGGGD